MSRIAADVGNIAYQCRMKGISKAAAIYKKELSCSQPKNVPLDMRTGQADNIQPDRQSATNQLQVSNATLSVCSKLRCAFHPPPR